MSPGRQILPQGISNLPSATTKTKFLAGVTITRGEVFQKMSQSKMLLIDNTEHKFVMKCVIKDVKNLLLDRRDGVELCGPVEKHFDVEWQLAVTNCCEYCKEGRVYLDCLHDEKSCDWSIETEFSVSVGHQFLAATERIFTQTDRSKWRCFEFKELGEYSSKDSMPIEIHVTIKKMTGIEKEKLKSFDDDEAKKHSDVALKIGDQKFHVYKVYLSYHSTYFKSLFSQHFAESQTSEIELKGIDPNDFQDFLELIYGVSLVNEETISGILKLADYFDAPIALQRCEEFLMKDSKNSLAEKLEMAIQYRMESLKSKCLEEMENTDDEMEADEEDFHDDRV